MQLKIAILGSRGVPNNYGGFEHIAGHLAKGLVRKGHAVTVYSSSRHPFQKKYWCGARIIHCFDPEHLFGMAGQFVYDLNCILDARKKSYDIILMLGYTSSSVWGFLYPSQSVVVNNMDGLEWQRSKYSRPVRQFLKHAEALAVRACHYHVADSPPIKQYLDNKYNISSRYIAYGASAAPCQDEKVLKQYGLTQADYYLMMARLEPENNIEMILDGYCHAKSGKKFVVIGNTCNSFGKRMITKYKREKEIIFLGPVFNERVTQSLTAFCGMYFHGHSVGGTNPSLLDAMAAEVPIAAHSNPFNYSVLYENALYFNRASEVCEIMMNDECCNKTFIRNNYRRITDEFTWERIVDRYEDYFMECYAERYHDSHVYQVREV